MLIKQKDEPNEMKNGRNSFRLGETEKTGIPLEVQLISRDVSNEYIRQVTMELEFFRRDV
ncbi:hypothetical protein [Sulfuracidifex tepidarius]|uniref:Uncharacterized protein n=1 Tax=Sulfuracidifex tepidarius TaxID=1294262 RepID=A0A510DYB6_9CREN|nr:hypothetical protein [Sulfuracidifex tepidarius]BBG25205.1 hypothetical protein IC006_2540 [Sulfuracidifex tepidarius]BBG27998.1 hypothetical protein IC007_2553 [Sulfuracidifex tepidarius]